MAGFLGAAALAACGSSPGEAGADGAVDPVDAGTPDTPPLIDAASEVTCASESALTPAELLAEIDTLVVLCMENRSFDHYFGALRLVEGRTDVAGLIGTETNPDPDGGSVGVHLLENFTPADPPHSWAECHRQWNQGANDGFVLEHAGSSQSDVMGYHVREQIPVLYALADQGALCDQWYASVLGPTWPNRYYLHGATSKGQKSNLPALGFTSIFDRLDDAGVSHANYYHDLAWASGGYAKLTGLRQIERFFDDAAGGNLPQFSLIDPQFVGGGANDDHPSHDIRLGQALIGSIAAALAQSPQWNRTLFVITYDEHGGFYDHVAPPTTIDDYEDFRQLGFRVPSVVIGPHVRRGCAVSTVFEHASIAATLTARYGLEPLNARAAAAADLSSCIDERFLLDPQAPPAVPAIKLERDVWRRRREVPGTHAELIERIERLGLPPALDRRGDADGISARVLARAERLGAISY